jgi:hypothetical protein
MITTYNLHFFLADLQKMEVIFTDLLSTVYLKGRQNLWVIIKIHALFCYYAINNLIKIRSTHLLPIFYLFFLVARALDCAIKRQISTKLIGENMFCMKAHQPSIVLPSKSKLVQLRIYTCYMKICSPFHKNS